MYEINNRIICCHDEEGPIDLTPLKNRGTIPTITLPQFHSTLSKEQVDQYFDDLKNIRVVVINGFSINNDTNVFNLECCYCNAIIIGIYYRCEPCDMPMCTTCYQEIVLGIPIPRLYPEHHRGKHICSDHKFNQLDTTTRHTTNFTFCDICYNFILTKYKHIDGHKNVCSKCYSNFETQKRALENCVVADSTKASEHLSSFIESWSTEDFEALNRAAPAQGMFPEEESTAYVLNDLPTDDAYNFGSLCDWYPLFQDDESSFLLININMDSKYYHNYAVASCDDHGRVGYYSLPTTMTLKDIITKLNDFAQNKEWLDLGTSWKRFYNYPIKRLMSELDYEIHYG